VPTPSISPDRLQRYIREVELPARLAVDGDTAHTIFRKGGFVGSVIEHHEHMARTMSHARTYIERAESAGRSVASGTVFIADTLHNSKGRFVRQWHAPAGGLWGSMIYVSTLLPATRLLLPLAVGISCCEALRDSGSDTSEIRWINDVLIDGKKVAGILMEGFFGTHSREEYNLIGFGININNSEFPETIKDTAVSLRDYLGTAADLQKFTYCFLAKLTWNFGLLCHAEDCYLQEEAWPGSHDVHPVIRRWSELSSTIGRRVQFGFDVMEDPQYQATVTGISETGGLMMKLDDGSEIVEHSGEIRYL